MSRSIKLSRKWRPCNIKWNDAFRHYWLSPEMLYPYFTGDVFRLQIYSKVWPTNVFNFSHTLQLWQYHAKLWKIEKQKYAIAVTHHQSNVCRKVRFSLALRCTFVIMCSTLRKLHRKKRNIIRLQYQLSCGIWLWINTESGCTIMLYYKFKWTSFYFNI